MFQGCFKDVSWGFQRDFRAVLRVFNGTFKGEGQSKYVWRKFQEVSGAFFVQENFKGVSTKFQGRFKRGLSKFQEYYMEISMVVHKCYRGVSKKIHIF